MTDAPTIHDLMGRVMADIDAVAKTDRNQAQNFSFRGIDSVVNAVGPVLRKHGVVMLPEAGVLSLDYYESRNGARMAHAVLPVTFHFWGPAGDSVSTGVIGEASDAGDKVVSKAHAVAWRIALLECFAIPTDDPDPDSDSHERAPAREPEIDWAALGWDDQGEHDTTRDGIRGMARALPDEAKNELRKWLSEKGWKFPYPADQMAEWSEQVIALTPDDHPPESEAS